MSNYSDNPAMVRVDFFKPSGKWYSTEAIEFLHGFQEDDIHWCFEYSLDVHLQGRMKGMMAVCLEPYHKNAHPLMREVK